MNEIFNSGLPIFFNYDEEGRVDSGYENLQDFFLSWTLRCSNDTYKNVNHKLNNYARKIVFALIYGENIGKKYQKI